MSLLFELEDQKWFPPLLRRMQLEYIGWLVGFLRVYQPLLPLLEQLGRNQNRIHDLCSGSGGPAIWLSGHLKNPWTLSDVYPASPQHLGDQIFYLQDSVDVLSLKTDPEVIYTMFNAFHHFTNEQQGQILRKLSHSRFVIAEILKPSPVDFIKIFCTTTLLQVLCAPFIKPFSFRRLIYTWILPINLITVTWDGLVSVLRSLPESRYRSFVELLKREGIDIHWKKMGPFWARVYVLYRQ